MSWTPWESLRGSWARCCAPDEPGLYQIRRSGRSDIDYVGQTGTTLRTRMGHLRGVFAAEMPYRDPHTAGPALWALRHLGGGEFEVSFTIVEGKKRHRLGQEALAFAYPPQPQSWHAP